MTMYVVNQVCDDEYGCTSVAGIFSTREKAQAFVDAHQYQWGAWFMKDGETRNALTISTYTVDEPEDFEEIV